MQGIVIQERSESRTSCIIIDVRLPFETPFRLKTATKGAIRGIVIQEKSISRVSCITLAAFRAELRLIRINAVRLYTGKAEMQVYLYNFRRPGVRGVRREVVAESCFYVNTTGKCHP